MVKSGFRCMYVCMYFCTVYEIFIMYVCIYVIYISDKTCMYVCMVLDVNFAYSVKPVAL